MTVIRLEVEVDSDIYPELYAGLRAIERPQAREERLRQLAAAGLVWENVRTRGAATVAPRHLPPVAANVPVLSDVVDDAAASGLHDNRRGMPQDVIEPGLPPALETGVYRPGSRSERVKRMRDRGLFKNG